MDSPRNEKARPTREEGEYQPHGHTNHPKPSNSDLLSSAKVLADAFTHRGDPDFDKAKAADAAADILHAASQYGNFDGKPMGNMVGKAEDYLHQYNSSHSSTTTAHPGSAGGHSTTNTHTSSESHSSNSPSKEQSQGHSSGGGYGDYMKMAEDLFNKNSGTGHGSDSGSGGAKTHSSENSNSGDGGNKYGEYMNMAEGVFNKYAGSGGNAHNNTTGDAQKNTSGEAPSGGEHGKSGSGSGGGYGEYAKLAGDFLKKH